jgi:PIN domain nuclease of toxin-antitoxin system
MRLILDTHIFLWYVVGDMKIGANLRHAIENCEAAYLSVVSLWEATIKYQLGKLPLPSSPHPWLFDQLEHHGILPLPLSSAAVARLSSLPSYRDPFDRMIVCQAIENDLTIVTVDRILMNYPARFFQPG